MPKKKVRVVKQNDRPIISYLTYGSDSSDFDVHVNNLIGSFKSIIFFGVKTQIWRIVCVDFDSNISESIMSKILLGIQNQLEIDFIYREQKVSFEIINAAKMLQECIDSPITVCLVKNKSDVDTKDLIIYIPEHTIEFCVKITEVFSHTLCKLLSNLQEILFILNKRFDAIDFLSSFFSKRNSGVAICCIKSVQKLVSLHKLIRFYTNFFPALSKTQQDLFLQKFFSSKSYYEWKSLFEILLDPSISYKLKVPGWDIKLYYEYFIKKKVLSFKCCDNASFVLAPKDLNFLLPNSPVVKLMLYLEVVCGKKLKDNILQQKLKLS